MTDEQMDDIKQFLETTIDNRTRAVVREELQPIDARLGSLEQRFDGLEQRFDEFAMVQNQILDAVGERFDDHEQRIKVLEDKPGSGAFKLRRAA